MKKICVFITIALFFILVISNSSSAITSNHTTEFKELTIKIQERIDSYSKQRLNFVNIIKRMLYNDPEDDPDGPIQGGLDDPSDFIALFWGLSGFLWILFPLPNLLNPENLKQFISGLLGTSAALYNMIMNFGEAFDVIEYKEDGC